MNIDHERFVQLLRDIAFIAEVLHLMMSDRHVDRDQMKEVQERWEGVVTGL